MNLTLRRGTKAGVITAAQHDALMELAPTVETRDAKLSPEAAMVWSIYNEAGGAPISAGMMGTLDRRAEVALPRVQMAANRYPGVDPEFFRGQFAELDAYHARQLARRMKEESKG